MLKKSEMKQSIDLSETKLSAKKQASIKAFCRALHDVPDLKVQSITLYGSAVRDDYRPRASDINLLVVLERIDVSTLKSMVNPVARGRRHGIAPFIATEADLRSSADVFPVKFLAMQESYRVLFGSDVLADLKIAREHIRLRCEQEIKNVLLRLRRYYVMRGGRRLAQMMSQMVGGLLDTLRVVVLLDQKDLPSREAVATIAAERFTFDAEILQNVIGLRTRRSPLPRREAEKLYDQFMATVSTIAQAVDQMS